MSTTIREKSTAALAEALHAAEDDCWPNATECFSPEGHAGQSRDILAASPTLASRLDFATAWDDAEAELPEETTLSLGASAGDALVELAAQLRERAR